MAKHPSKRSQGRPQAEKPKRSLISFRVDDETMAALEREREAMGILSFSISDTVREMVLRILKEKRRL